MSIGNTCYEGHPDVIVVGLRSLWHLDWIHYALPKIGSGEYTSEGIINVFRCMID